MARKKKPVKSEITELSVAEAVEQTTFSAPAELLPQGPLQETENKSIETDGVYEVCHTELADCREVPALYFVREPGCGFYHVYAGEAPHRKDGKWTASADVPHFKISAFRGAHIADREPDKVHVLHIEADETFIRNMDEQEERNREYSNELWALKMDKLYCTFPMYMKGLWQRLKRRFGNFEHVANKAGTYNSYEYNLLRKDFSMGIVFDDRTDDVCLFMHDSEWRRWVYLKRGGRRMFEFIKTENTHDYCSVD